MEKIKIDWKIQIGAILSIAITIVAILISNFSFTITNQISAYETRLSSLEKVISQGQIERLNLELSAVNDSLTNVEKQLNVFGFSLDTLIHLSETYDPNSGTSIIQSPLVSISYPTTNSNVTWREQIIGDTKISNNKTLRIYVLIYPESLGKWFVQNNVTINPDGTWYTQTYFGDPSREKPEQIGKKFNLVAIVTDITYYPGDTISELPRALSSDVVIGLTRGE